jgi:hypothetical protein
LALLGHIPSSLKHLLCYAPTHTHTHPAQKWCVRGVPDVDALPGDVRGRTIIVTGPTR